MPVGVEPGDGFPHAHKVKEAVSFPDELLAAFYLDQVIGGHYIGNIRIGSFADGVQVSAGHVGTGTSLEGTFGCNKVSLGQSQHFGIVVTEVDSAVAREFVEPCLCVVVL